MSSSSSSFASTVDLRLRPSIRALRVIFLLHVLCIGLLPFAVPTGWPMLALLAAFAVSWLSLRRHPALGFGPRALTRIVYHADGSWSIHFGKEERRAELIRGSVVHRRLLVLCFREVDGRRRAARVITGDEASEDMLRRLRARLSVASEKAEAP